MYSTRHALEPYYMVHACPPILTLAVCPRKKNALHQGPFTKLTAVHPVHFSDSASAKSPVDAHPRITIHDKRGGGGGVYFCTSQIKHQESVNPVATAATLAILAILLGGEASSPSPPLSSPSVSSPSSSSSSAPGVRPMARLSNVMPVVCGTFGGCWSKSARKGGGGGVRVVPYVLQKYACFYNQLQTRCGIAVGSVHKTTETTGAVGRETDPPRSGRYRSLAESAEGADNKGHVYIHDLTLYRSPWHKLTDHTARFGK